MYNYHLAIFWHFKNLYLQNSFHIITSMSFKKTKFLWFKRKPTDLSNASSYREFKVLWPLCFMSEVAAVLILSSLLGQLSGRKAYAWIVEVWGDLDVSPLNVGPRSPQSEGHFSKSYID